ncbi:CAP domain-containing protein [Croceitalea rosinachiae]|uniref:CAP domain-containing protein n=1 Tax=Croceitalea rosinachiae TaxID=3075596 RepID=A0ABU3A8J0_9FLAO|nr:CAP domain-containing protein [Croceitalea sp. F388]MDT0606486.1 CAP domain-containing protein [Croceitalea sp. F388]
MKLHYTILFISILAFTSCSTTSVQDEEVLFENEETALIISEKESELFNIVNTYRTSYGLSELTFSTTIYKYAQEHTQFMIVEDEISHDNFNARATQIAKETSATHIAENVAKNYPDPEMALQGWLDSATHKNTIEGNFTHTSISIKENSEGELFYTQIFFKK